MSKKSSKMPKYATYAAGALLLLVFAGFSYSKFVDAVTPYVDYEAARATERTVQVAGGLLQGSSAYDAEDQTLHFTLVDQENEGEQMKVRYDGLKPANFEDAISIVAIGKYDADAGDFVANDLLVKCPSKYQGIEGYEEKSYSAESKESLTHPETRGNADGASGSTSTYGE